VRTFSTSLSGFKVERVAASYRRTGELSISFLSDENRSFASVGLGGAAVGGALSIPDHTARSNSERAVPSVCVGNRFRFLKSFGGVSGSGMSN